VARHLFVSTTCSWLNARVLALSFAINPCDYWRMPSVFVRFGVEQDVIANVAILLADLVFGVALDPRNHVTKVLWTENLVQQKLCPEDSVVVKMYIE
jgi:hypothetical protein